MPALQRRGLLEALHAESAAGLLPEADAQRLEAAYRFLRRTEHALQYREDEQTHLLPGDPALRAALAAALGMQAGEFEDTLAAHRAFVSRTFRNVFRLVGMGDAEGPRRPPMRPTRKNPTNSASWPDRSVRPSATRPTTCCGAPTP